MQVKRFSVSVKQQQQFLLWIGFQYGSVSHQRTDKERGDKSQAGAQLGFIESKPEALRHRRYHNAEF